MVAVSPGTFRWTGSALFVGRSLSGTTSQCWRHLSPCCFHATAATVACPHKSLLCLVRCWCTITVATSRFVASCILLKHSRETGVDPNPTWRLLILWRPWCCVVCRDDCGNVAVTVAIPVVSCGGGKLNRPLIVRGGDRRNFVGISRGDCSDWILLCL